MAWIRWPGFRSRTAGGHIVEVPQLAPVREVECSHVSDRGYIAAGIPDVQVVLPDNRRGHDVFPLSGIECLNIQSSRPVLASSAIRMIVGSAAIDSTICVGGAAVTRAKP
jgi:hypothetical protein